MPLSYVTKGFLEQLELLEPFGVGNSKPVFAQKNLKFLSMRTMGKLQNMAKFTVEDENGNRFSLILFRNLEQFLNDVKEKYGLQAYDDFASQKKTSEITMSVIYYPSLNEFMGKQEIQYVMQNWN